MHLKRIKEFYDSYVKETEKEDLGSSKDNFNDRKAVIDHLGFHYEKLSTKKYKELRRSIVRVKGSIFRKTFCFWKHFFPEKKDLEDYEIFVLHIGRTVLKKYAKENQMKMYDSINNYFEPYNEEKSYKYEEIRDTTKQYILIDILQKEFDMEKFSKAGILLDHFPMHNYQQRANIMKYWKLWFSKSLLSPLNPFGTDPRAYVPVIQIGYYHGVQNGFFFQFLINYTSWTFLLAIFGIVTYFVSMLFFGSANNILILVSWFIVSMWSSNFLHNWRRTEKSLSMLLDTSSVYNKFKVS